MNETAYSNYVNHNSKVSPAARNVDSIITDAQTQLAISRYESMLESARRFGADAETITSMEQHIINLKYGVVND